MKTTITVPDPLLRRVERHAARLNMSRSEFFARATARFVDDLDDQGLMEAIDAALLEAGVDVDRDFGASAVRLAFRDQAPTE